MSSPFAAGLELDKETIRISPIKRESEQIEQGVEAILTQASPIKLRKWPRTEIFKLETIQEPESIFSESYIQKTMKLSGETIKTNEEEIKSIQQDEFDKLIDKFEEWENETIEQQEKVAKQSSQTESVTQIKAIKKAPIQPKMQSNEKSNIWLAIGVASVLTTMIIAVYYSTLVIAAIASLGCAWLIYNSMFRKTSSPNSMLEEPREEKTSIKIMESI